MHQEHRIWRLTALLKTNKSFTTGEELILPACTDICHEVFKKLADKKIAQVSLSSRTVARRIEDMPEDIETQLLQRFLRHHGLRFSMMSQPILKTKLYY